MANQLGNNGGRFYSTLNRPILVEGAFTVTSTNGLGITGLKGANVKDVFMYTSTTPTRGNNGVTNPLTVAGSQGLAWINLKVNYNKLLGVNASVQSPIIGSSVVISSTALTVGQPYQILTVGHATAGAVTIAPVADTAGSLASTWFSLYDAYGNTFIIWFSVAGVGSAPNLGVAAAYGTQGLHYVQQSIASGDTAGTIGTALAVTIAALPSGVSGVFSFTTAGTTTVTATSTATNPYGPVAGPPADGLIPTGFTFVQTKYKTNQQNWAGVGLPAGVVPAIGAAFIATATGDSTGGSSTGTVTATGVSTIGSVEVIGDANTTLAPAPSGGSTHRGAWVLVQFVSPQMITFSSAATHTSGTVDTLTPSNPILAGVKVGMGIWGTGIPLGDTVASVISSAIGITAAATASATVPITVGPANVPFAPVDGSVVKFSFYLEAGSIVIAGD